MIDSRRTAVIVNPASRKGRVGRELPEIEARLRRGLGEDIQVCPTQASGHATELAMELVRSGFETIVSMGGDGTHSEVCHGIVSAGGGASMGVLHAGTGGDFRKLLTVSDDIDGACELIATTAPDAIDVGEVSFVKFGGSESRRTFLNLASLGIGGLVDKLVNESTSRIRGSAAFAMATLEANNIYKPATVRVRIDGVEVGTWDIANICICNGRYAGGGMHFAPTARLADGLFDVVVMEAASTLRSLPVVAALYRGRHLSSSLVSFFQGRDVEVTPTTLHPAWLDVDGEAPGVGPARFVLREKALRVHGLRPDVL